MSEHEEEGYTGSATVVADDAEIAVQSSCAGISSRSTAATTGTAGSPPIPRDRARRHGKKQVLLRTPEGEAVTTLSDVDPWGRFRVTGTSRPPFAIETSPAEA